jgi:hypothetical protein
MGNCHFQTFFPVTQYRGTVPKKQDSPGDGILRSRIIDKEAEFFTRSRINHSTYARSRINHSTYARSRIIYSTSARSRMKK